MRKPLTTIALCTLFLLSAAGAHAVDATQRAMVEEIRAAHTAAQEKIDALVADLDPSAPFETRIEVYREVSAIKRGVQRRQLEIQVEYAQRRGNAELAARLQAEIADFDARFGRTETPKTEGGEQ